MFFIHWGREELSVNMLRFWRLQYLRCCPLLHSAWDDVNAWYLSAFGGVFFSVSPSCISLLCIKCSSMHWRGARDVTLKAVTPEYQGTIRSPLGPSHRFFHHLALPGEDTQDLLCMVAQGPRLQKTA